MEWLLSLSVVSLMGPKCDVDYLVANGFYKKNDNFQEGIERHIYLDREKYRVYVDRAHQFLEILEIKDARSFEKKMDELLDGSEFALNMETMLQLGRTMDMESRSNQGTVIVNNHPYLFELFETLMTFEFQWPKYGMRAYELANAVMLLRLGVDLDYIDRTRQGYYFEDIQLRLDKIFENYKDFGQAAIIGGVVHSKYLELISNGTNKIEWNDVLSIAYYGIWQYFE